MYSAEVGTNNIISKAQRSFQPIKAQRKMRNLIFLKLLRRNAIPERYFRTKLKRNLTSGIKTSQHYVNTAFFTIFERVNNLLKKADIYQFCDRNGTKLRSMYETALLTEKNLKAQRNYATNFKNFSPQRNFRNVSK